MGAHSPEWRPDWIVIVDVAIARTVGVLIAILAAFGLWRLACALKPATCFRAFLFMAACSVLIAVWSSPVIRDLYLWPTCFVVILGGLGAVVRMLRNRGDGGGTKSSTAVNSVTMAAILAVAVLGANLSVIGQTPTPRVYPVYVIGGAKPIVLVTPDLIAKLDDLEKQSAVGSAGAVLVSGKYSGKIEDAQAKMEVLYEIHSFKDKTNLVVPLVGVQLGEGAFLDGAPAFLAPVKNGYSVSIRGPGSHHLRLSFSVPVRVAPKTEQSDLQCTIPKLSQNEITLQWQKPVQALHCLRGWGEEKMVADTHQAITEWRAQLGYENEFHLRWSATAAPTAPTDIEIKEAAPMGRSSWLAFALKYDQLCRPSGWSHATGCLDAGRIAGSKCGCHGDASPTPAGPGCLQTLDRRRQGAYAPADCRSRSIGGWQHYAVPRTGAEGVWAAASTGAAAAGARAGQGNRRRRLSHGCAEARNSVHNLVAVQSITVDDFDKHWKKRSGATRAKSYQRTNSQPGGLELLDRAKLMASRFSAPVDHRSTLCGRDRRFQGDQPQEGPADRWIPRR